jgi:hypothetical protein
MNFATQSKSARRSLIEDKWLKFLDLKSHGGLKRGSLNHAESFQRDQNENLTLKEKSMLNRSTSLES